MFRGQCLAGNLRGAVNSRARRVKPTLGDVEPGGKDPAPNE